MDRDISVVYVKIDDIYKEIAEDLSVRCDTSNYEMNRPLPKGKDTKLITGIIKDKFDEKIFKEFVGLRAKNTQKCIIKNP